MDDLSEKLLPRSTGNTNYLKPVDTRNRNRLSLKPYRFQPIQESSFEFQNQDDFNRKQYYSIVEEPELVWNSEQILERSLLLQQQKPQPQPESQQELQAPTQSIKSQSKQSTYKSIIKPKAQQPKKKTALNHRLFLMKSRPRLWIYCFNYFFNVLFRVGLVILLVQLLIEGDGDQNQEEEKIFIKILLGLEGLVTIFYFLALTKFLYTKSCDISVYFQKQFYEMPYSQIHMLRIMRKHFTANKIMSNLWRMINPFTKFSKDIKIAFMRQQIYKRIEIMIVFVPLFVVFLIGTPWFDRSQETNVQFDVKLLMAIIVCMQGIHIILHYLFVYIFS